MVRDISAIRREFNDGKLDVSSSLDRWILDSWRRCAANNLSMSGSADYRMLSRIGLEETVWQNRLFLNASARHLESLYHAISGAGWSILLTDADCTALQTYRSTNLNNKKIFNALSEGAVLSEEVIGTSAMSCALDGERLVSVFAEQHYKECHDEFHCVAMPIYDQYGKICGTVDITNESPRRDFAASYLLEKCAGQIQDDIVKSIPESICIEVFSGLNGVERTPDIILAVSNELRIVGANQFGLKFFSLDLPPSNIGFCDLFEEDPSILFDRQGRNRNAFELTLRNGVRLAAKVAEPAVDTRLEKSSRKYFLGSSVTADRSRKFPYFGDRRIDSDLNKCVTAIQKLPVLLLGESGVGKEITAKAIHDNSQNRAGEFVAVNCASIPETLIESELFGYEKGAFTGASKNGSCGKIEQADGGTLFLDEIGDMPVALQTRLLRVLETKEVSRVGSVKQRQVNFQLICATHRNLPEAIERKEFRQDLYYRVNGFCMTLPPLRDREDVVGLADSILNEISENERTLDSSARRFIEACQWPGNVRELKHSLLYADTLSASPSQISVKDFPQDLQAFSGTEVVADVEEGGDGKVLKQACDATIAKAIKRFDGNKSKAAAYLGISRATLYRKLPDWRQ